MTSKQRWILVLASVASLMVALDSLVVSTALSSDGARGEPGSSSKGSRTRLAQR